MASEKPKSCPKCNSKNFAAILWGYPVKSSKLDKALREKEVVLGGCCVLPDDSKWECNDCSHTWGLRES